MIELKGGTVNPVIYNPDFGIVTKGFLCGNGISENAHNRKNAEIFSLQTIPMTPDYLGGYDTKILMSFVDGEKYLDDMVRSLPESQRYAVFDKAGETLAMIHRRHICTVPQRYHIHHEKKVLDAVKSTHEQLARVGCDAFDMLSYLKESYDAEEINRWGLVWTHGDYWLANIIGTLKKENFFVNGIIDWELSKMGSPYEDFAIVKMSIEDIHDGASFPFWNGYKRIPNRNMINHFAVMKTLEWIRGEDAGNPLDSEFYQTKFSMMRKIIAGKVTHCL